ncbi:MAG TPA: DNA polymerase III subunit chi [Gammaproteobacteria bacterium]
MPHVDFYILADSEQASLQQYACKLAQQHWSTGKHVLVQTDSVEDSQQLDELLWNLQADSFIPHGIATLEPVDQQQPILIANQAVNDSRFDVVLNLSSRPCDITEPDKALQIEEILNQDEQRKQSGRAHYKIYRERGYSLQHHTLQP